MSSTQRRAAPVDIVEHLNGRIGDQGHQRQSCWCAARMSATRPRVVTPQPGRVRQRSTPASRRDPRCGEQRQRILDLSLLEEAAAARHLVGHAALPKRAHRGLHVDVLAEEPGDIRGSRPGGDEASAFARHRHCLAALLGSPPHLDGRSRPRSADQLLLDPRRGTGDRYHHPGSATI